MLFVACSENAFADTVYQTRDDFLRELFGTPPQARVLWLDNAAQDKLKAVLGHPYGLARLRYWRADGKTATLQQIESRARRSGWTCPRGCRTRVRYNWSVMD